VTGELTQRRDAAVALMKLAVDVHDIRAAQPALALALLDDDLALRRAALDATLERVEGAGADVRLAFPALMRLVNDEDASIRRDAWATLALSDARSTKARGAFIEIARRASEDADSEVREWAARALQKMER
jgi:hypothetical protein